MDRREFLKKTAAMGLGAGVLFLPKGLRGPVKKVLAADAAGAGPHLAAVRGGGTAAMYERGMRALGGMDKFVKKGQKVLIKPNMSWDMAREFASNTPPELVAAVIRDCQAAGASRVVVMDHSIEFWENSRAQSGIGDVIKETGAIYAPAERERYYQEMKVGGVTLKEVAVHESLLECDVFISVPVLKNHGGAGVSISLKNLMGCVWDRRTYHSKGIQQCIADFMLVRKPDLSIVDASRVIMKHGPRGGSLEDVVEMRSMIVSPDIVAADTAASMLLGRKQGEVEHIRLAAEAGFGEMDLSKLNIDRITI